MDIRNLIKILGDKNISVWKAGDNIKFKAPKGSLTNELKEELKRNKADLMKYLEDENNIYFRIDEESRYEEFPLTDIQNSYLLGRSAAFELGGVGCHGYMEIVYDEKLDHSKLELAWNKVIEKHDMLRAIVYENGKQRVQKEVPYVDVERVVSNNEEEIYLREKLSNKQYVIGTWPMCDIAITEFNNSSLLHLSIDMIVADFVSMNIILEDLEHFYKNPEDTIVSTPRFRDIVIYEKDKSINDKNREKDNQYWAKKIENMSGGANIPTLQMMGIETNSFYQKNLFLNSNESKKLLNIAHKLGVTPSAMIMAALSEIVYYWSGSKKFCINTTLFNRDSFNIECINNVVGDFTDINVSLIEIDSKNTFKERINSIQKDLWNDLQHKSIPGVEILRELSKSKGENIIVPIVFTSTLGISNKDDVILKRKVNYRISQTPQVYLDCQVSEENNGIRINWDIRKGVFNEKIIEDMFWSFSDIIKNFCRENLKYFETKNPIILSNRTIKTRENSNSTAGKMNHALLTDGFIKSLNNNPDKTALIYKKNTLSYKKLACYVDTIINILKKENILKNERVGVNIEKNEWQIASVLAILIYGAVYVPIDVEQPITRKNKIVDISKIKLMISDENNNEKLNCKNIVLDKSFVKEQYDEINFKTRQTSSDDAYIIFTSGTTGVPKGVRISHESAMNTILDVNKKYHLCSKDVFLGLAKLSFDLSVYDIFGCFDVCGTLVLPEPDKTNNPKYLYDLILLHRISIWNSVPAQMHLLVNYLDSSPDIKRSEDIRLCLLSGDWIPINLPNDIYRIFKNVLVVSMGGATEASIWSIYYNIDRKENFTSSVPYGYPMKNQKFYILNKDLNPAPNYIKGNLYIAGAGLSKGYIGDEKLNQEKYSIYENTNERIYKTGDTGFYNSEGLIIFTGRETDDSQIKINGYRVELTEIKNAILNNEKVSNAELIYNREGALEGELSAIIVPKLQKKGKSIQIISDENLQFLKEKDDELVGRINSELLDRWNYYSQKISLASMMKTFNEFNIFLNLDQSYTFKEIKDLIGVPNKLDKLLRRWLYVLTTEGLLNVVDEKYSLGNKKINKSLDELWDEFYKIESELKIGGEFLNYLKESNNSLPRLIVGDEDPLNLLFPKGGG